ncbi:MAG: hypothetical protein HYX34_06570 [Actinobacteria bacterium]|nr:hypothetical protein [Actinomycetota bacterium]
MSSWKRWVGYARAKLDDALSKGDAELDRREARLEAEAAERPWLRADGEAPTLDEVRARIRAEARVAEEAARRASAERPAPDRPVPPAAGEMAPRAPSSPTSSSSTPGGGAGGGGAGGAGGAGAGGEGAAIDLEAAEQQRAADERLGSIRRELGLEGGGEDRK